jgi:hypothetical protein
VRGGARRSAGGPDGESERASAGGAPSSLERTGEATSAGLWRCAWLADGRRRMTGARRQHARLAERPSQWNRISAPVA